MKLLPIPGCQTIVTEERSGPASVRVPARLCGATSVAVIREDDGQEHFVCQGHRPDQAATAPAWRLHRREVAAGPISAAGLRRWTGHARGRRRADPDEEPRPKKAFSAEARKRIADGQRARWERIRAAKDNTAA